MDKISIIVSCYNEEKTVNILIDKLEEVAQDEVFKDVEFEYVFVNDGSKDETLNILKKLSAEKKNVRYISFSRNFGK